MSDREFDPLTTAERAAVVAWAEADVAPDFADRVMDAWRHEEAGGTVHAEAGSRRRRFPRLVVAVTAAAAAALLAWLGLRPSAGPPGTSAAATDAWAEATPALLDHCAPCHDGTDPRAEPAALEAFDASAELGYASLDERRLLAMLDRLETSAMPASQREAVVRFVAARRRG